MAKVAQLVYIDLVVRVIVNDDDAEEYIIAAAFPKVQNMLNNYELFENVSEIKLDEQCPYNAETDNV